MGSLDFASNSGCFKIPIPEINFCIARKHIQPTQLCVKQKLSNMFVPLENYLCNLGRRMHVCRYLQSFWSVSCKENGTDHTGPLLDYQPNSTGSSLAYSTNIVVHIGEFALQLASCLTRYRLTRLTNPLFVASLRHSDIKHHSNIIQARGWCPVLLNPETNIPPPQHNTSPFTSHGQCQEFDPCNTKAQYCSQFGSRQDKDLSISIAGRLPQKRFLNKQQQIVHICIQDVSNFWNIGACQMDSNG